MSKAGLRLQQHGETKLIRTAKGFVQNAAPTVTLPRSTGKGNQRDLACFFPLPVLRGRVRVGAFSMTYKAVLLSPEGAKECSHGCSEVRVLTDGAKPVEIGGGLSGARDRSPSTLHWFCFGPEYMASAPPVATFCRPFGANNDGGLWLNIFCCYVTLGKIFLRNEEIKVCNTGRYSADRCLFTPSRHRSRSTATGGTQIVYQS